MGEAEGERTAAIVTAPTLGYTQHIERPVMTAISDSVFCNLGPVRLSRCIFVARREAGRRRARGACGHEAPHGKMLLGRSRGLYRCIGVSVAQFLFRMDPTLWRTLAITQPASLASMVAIA